MHDLNRYLAAHHGVLTRSKALSAGMTEDQIRRVVRSGEWVRVHAGVYRVASAPESWRSRARSAALSGRGLTSHSAALRVWGVDGYERYDIVHITSPSQRFARSLKAGRYPTRLHRSDRFDLADGRMIDGIPVTGIARSVFDSAALVDDAGLDCIVDAVLRQRLCRLEDLLATVDAHGTRGRAGAGRLKRLLLERHEERIPDSRFNRMVGRLLVDAGLEPPIYEHEVDVNGRRLRVDLAYPDHGLTIECDSARWHHNRRSFELDPKRRNLLVAAGFRVLSFTWHDYAGDPEGLVAAVRGGLRDKGSQRRKTAQTSDQRPVRGQTSAGG